MTGCGDGNDRVVERFGILAVNLLVGRIADAEIEFA